MGLLALIALLLLVGAVVRLLTRKSVVTGCHRAWSSIPRHDTVGPMISTLRAVAWCCVAPASVMIIFVSLAGGWDHDWNRFVFARRFVPPQQLNSVDPVVPLDSPAKDHESDLVRNRPNWIAEGEQTSDNVRRVVLSSHLWSTEAEAMHELQTKAAAMIRADFELRHHGPFSSAGKYFLSDQRLVEAAVKERYVERVEQDFGKFSSPMNRLWWQVEISPLVRTEIYPAWKAAVVRRRVIVIASALALLTLVANIVGLRGTLVRLRDSTNCRATT